MAGETGLRIGFRYIRSQQEIDDGTFARAGPAHDDDMQWRGRLSLQIRPNSVAHQGRGEAQLRGLRRKVGLPARMLFQPGQVIAQLDADSPRIDRLHQRLRSGHLRVLRVSEYTIVA